VDAYKVDQSHTGSDRRLTLDQDSFEELLAAAYVVQEHTVGLHVAAPGNDSSQALAEIVETRKLLQTESLDFEAAADLIAKRTQKIIKASAVTVGVLKDGKLCYQAAAGTPSVHSGQPVPPDSYLNRGEPLECSDTANSRERFLQLAAEKGIKALLVLPLYRDRRFLGFLELQFAKANSFQEGDIRAAQLLVSLLVEAADVNRKTSPYSLSEEHEKMLKLLEELRPELERLQGKDGLPQAPEPDQNPSKQASAVVPPSALRKDAGVLEATVVCRTCGNVLIAGESFCGVCGSARSERSAHEDGQLRRDSLSPRQATQETRPSVFHEPVRTNFIPARPAPSASPSFEQFLTEVAANTRPAGEASTPGSKPVSDLSAGRSREIDAELFLEPDSTAPEDSQLVEPTGQETAEDATVAELASTPSESALQKLESTSTALVPLRIIPTDPPASEGMQLSPWKSAFRARPWLKLGGADRAAKAAWAQQLWQKHRANIWVAVSGCILLAVILNWSTQPPVSSASPGVKGHGRPAPTLTIFERLLVTLGLAVPPQMPAFAGNPESKVWVDVHTALYYCPGADLYGKTPGGRYTSQKDAQQDQFEPAHRRACQ
jgi:GAF domain